MKPLVKIFFLVLALAGCAADEPASGLRPYTHPRGAFSAGLPPGWDIQERGRDLNPGLQALAPVPAGGTGFRHSIAIYFYQEGNISFPSLDAYLSRKSLPIPGRTQGPVTDITVNGLPGKQFEATRPFPSVPELPDMEGNLKSRSVLLSARGGFYLLRYSGPENDFARYLGTFEKVVGALRPTP